MAAGAATTVGAAEGGAAAGETGAAALASAVAAGRGRGRGTSINIPAWMANDDGPRELELELIQTQMAQKPMLRGEVGARAWRV